MLFLRAFGVCCFVLTLATCEAEAILIPRGGGMIYDSDLDVTWLQEMNYAYASGGSQTGFFSWYEAQAWTDGLVYGGFDDWRLPSLRDLSGSISFTDNEIAHVYYAELGNTNSSNSNLGPFTLSNPTSLDLVGFWLEELNAGSGGYFHWSLPGSQWGFTDGHVKTGYVGGEFLSGGDVTDGIAWAVRAGDVAQVPGPGTLGLMGIALPLLMIHGRRKRSARCGSM